MYTILVLPVLFSRLFQYGIYTHFVPVFDQYSENRPKNLNSPFKHPTLVTPPYLGPELMLDEEEHKALVADNIVLPKSSWYVVHTSCGL